MGISALAEGVETKDQLAALKLLGCPVGQGFYFSQPLRAEEFDELLTRHFARTTGPARPVVIDKSASTPSITTVSSVRACLADASALPG